MAIVLHRYLP